MQKLLHYDCKDLRRIKVTFHWIPSHVGIAQNEKNRCVSQLFKCGAGKDEVDVIMSLVYWANKECSQERTLSYE